MIDHARIFHIHARISELDGQPLRQISSIIKKYASLASIWEITNAYYTKR